MCDEFVGYSCRKCGKMASADEWMEHLKSEGSIEFIPGCRSNSKQDHISAVVECPECGMVQCIWFGTKFTNESGYDPYKSC